jgi:hypothetical protein
MTSRIISAVRGLGNDGAESLPEFGVSTTSTTVRKRITAVRMIRTTVRKIIIPAARFCAKPESKDAWLLAVSRTSRSSSWILAALRRNPTRRLSKSFGS